MKTRISILYSIALIGISCDTDCDGCGPIRYTRYDMKNERSEDIHLIWFRYGEPDEFVIAADEKVLLYVASSEPPSLYLISTDPFGNSDRFDSFDSVRLASASNVVTYSRDECELKGNPLCGENYKLIKHVDTKKEKSKEWEFVILP